MPAYFIHAKAPDMKRSLLVGSDGVLVSKRIFALFWTDKEQATEVLNYLKTEVPEYEFKLTS